MASFMDKIKNSFNWMSKKKGSSRQPDQHPERTDRFYGDQGPDSD